ncbi:hypothetical protein ONE63_006851 [Megalurothrips usitatus]|uniref:Uncharacterized protein n=1 Tax=Megalurothrips usitatus TaxID=439358 RepID=A0AAV7XUB0_9NEOP|nr:hypothetical protein ONE63_006851 [Megalurothrips usitatus]
MPDRHPHGHVHGPGHGPGHRVNGVIAEGPGPPDEEGCPRPCGDHDASNTQCLRYLRESNKDSVCGSMELDKFRLRHCCEHSVGRSLTPEALQAVRSSSSQCSHYLGALLELDTLAARLSCEFGEILTRYDCDHPYSVNFQCKHCQVSAVRLVHLHRYIAI